MRADMTVYQPGDFLYNLLIKKSKYVINRDKSPRGVINSSKIMRWSVRTDSTPYDVSVDDVIVIRHSRDVIDAGYPL